MIDHLNAVVLPVKDVKACAFFYRDKLGLSLDELQEEEAYLTMGAQKAPVIALKSLAMSAREVTAEKIKPEQEPVKRVQLVVFVPDIVAEKAALEAKGVKFFDAVSGEEGEWRTAHFEDPEGNIWEIAQRPKR